MIIIEKKMQEIKKIVQSYNNKDINNINKSILFW